MIELNVATATYHFSLSHVSATASYVICNYDGVVLRRSASILKGIAENIAQVRGLSSLFVDVSALLSTQ